MATNNGTRAAKAGVKTKPSLQPLTSVQERMCDQLADLIVNGGAENDVEGMLGVVLNHQYDKLTPGHGFPDPVFDECLEDLLAAQEANRHAPEAEKIEPQAAGQRFRFRSLERCESYFTDFLKDCTSEELSLMIEVLDRRYANSRGPGHGILENYLATAFDHEVRSGKNLISVPDKLVSPAEHIIGDFSKLKKRDSPNELHVKGMSRYSMTEWDAETLGHGVAEIPLSEDEFRFVLNVLTQLHGEAYVSEGMKPTEAAN